MDYKEIQKDLKTKKVDAQILSKLISSGINKAFIYETYSFYKDHEDISNNANIYLIDYFKKIKKNETPRELRNRYESFDDAVQKNSILNKAKKLIKPISSKSYRHLFSIDGKTEKMFIELVMLGVDKKFIQDNIAQNIKTFRNSDELNTSLEKLISHLKEWNINATKNELKNYNVSVISTANNKIIFEVEDFESSKKFGSDIWCITREEDTFETYRDDVSRIIFCYDFNHSFIDNESITAYIVSPDTTIDFAHYKDNEDIEKNDCTFITDFLKPMDEDDFEYRLERMGYSEEDIFVTMLSHGIKSEYMDLEDFNFNNCSSEPINKLLERKKSTEILRIANEIPELFLEIGVKKGVYLEKLFESMQNSYDLEYKKLILKLLQNDKLFDAIQKHKILISDPIHIIGYYTDDLDLQKEFLEIYLEKSDTNLIDYLNKTSYMTDQMLDVLNSIDNNIPSILKQNNHETAFKILSMSLIEKGANYLDINTNDISFINYLNQKAPSINFEERQKLLSVLGKRGIILKENDPTKEIKELITAFPRTMTRYKEQINLYNIKLTEEETIDTFSSLVFGKQYKDIKNADILDIEDDLQHFNLATPLIKILVKNPVINKNGYESFIKILENFNLKNPKSQENIIKLKKIGYEVFNNSQLNKTPSSLQRN